ncbi:MAG: carboxypeptidase regulatory-like domain-containing protein, partial [Deltaproteobacteria bacterium]|nr:carboxypeptidase regulatory-like domain-containing protein [Deltaproteobacteria bacterium]
MPVKRSDHRLALFVFLIGFLGSGSWGLGQTTAAIVGTVIDESRAVIPGVTVTATHLDTRASRSSLTDEQGRYHLSNLRVGAYEVRAELTGFTSQVRRGIDLNIGEEAVINFQLRLGEITEVVSVTAETPFINTTQATIAGV